MSPVGSELRVCRRALTATALLVVFLGRVHTAHAQSPNDEVQAAEQFDLAMARQRAGDWQGACAAFEASERLAPSFGARLNRAYCEQRADRLLNAAALLRDAVAEADAREDDVRADRARADLSQVIAITPTIRFELDAGLDVRATIDGVEVTDLQAATFADPGRHEVVVQVDGVEKIRKSILLIRAQVEIVRLRPRAARASSHSSQAKVVVGLGAGALVLAGAGAYFMTAAGRHDDEAQAACPGVIDCPGTATIARDLNQRAVFESRLGLAMLAGAGLVASAGVVIWWRARESGSVSSVTARPMARGAAIAVGGTF